MTKLFSLLLLVAACIIKVEVLAQDEGLLFEEDVRGNGDDTEEYETDDSDQQTERLLLRDTSSLGRKGLCVIGCTPYVDLSTEANGLAKYRAMVKEMARKCDVIVHIGDTKPGSMPCMRRTMTLSVRILRSVAKRYGKVALYAPGDNEINDCHRHLSKLRANETAVEADIYAATDARSFLISNLKLANPTDLTQQFEVENHDTGDLAIPGTTQPYNCRFNKYIELDHYAVATTEVVGSHWYLDDEREDGYPYQDSLRDRLFLYLNAKDCALEWIETSAAKASANGKRALFILFHAKFHDEFGNKHLGNNGIGDFFNTFNLKAYTREFGGEEIAFPYQPLFDKLTEVARRYVSFPFFV